MDASYVFIILLVALLLFQHLKYTSNTTRISKLIHDLCTRKNNISFIRFGPRPLRNAIADLELLQHCITDIERRVLLEDFNLKAILSGMVEGVFVTNASGTIILANNRLSEIFQLKSSPLHKTVLEALNNHQASHAIKETLRNQKPGRWEINIHPDTDPATSRLFVTLTTAPVINSQNELQGAVAVLHDISTLKQVEILQREFVSNTSHELRTPLAIFRGYLEELLEAPPSSKRELIKILESLLKQTDRLQALVQDLLTLSQFESRTITLKKKPLMLSALIEESICELRRVRELGNFTITIKSRLPHKHDVVLVDENRIKQVLSNLIENSIKYSGQNGKITILTNPSSQHEFIECSVSDTGIGIPDKDLPHIFDRFYRADKGRVRSTGGTGLGLSIVKQIIEAHGGSVTASSQINQGTTITFTLPRATPAQSESHEQKKSTFKKTSRISNPSPSQAASAQAAAANRSLSDSTPLVL